MAGQIAETRVMVDDGVGSRRHGWWGHRSIQAIGSGLGAWTNVAAVLLPTELGVFA